MKLTDIRTWVLAAALSAGMVGAAHARPDTVLVDKNGVAYEDTHPAYGALVPTANANSALTESHCTAACASLSVSGAHNLFSINFSSTATGWLLLESGTTCAVDGTVAPVRAYANPTAGVTTVINLGAMPFAFASGFVACYSTTGPFTATTSTTAFIGFGYK